MNESQSIFSCAANGCPLMGTVKTATNGEVDWFCPCHFNRQPGHNDAVTVVLNRHRHIAGAIRDIREFYGTDEWANVFRGIQKALREAERADMTISDHEPVRAWLSRLEKALSDLTRECGKQQRIRSTLPTAQVIGPTHAAAYFGEVA